MPAESRPPLLTRPCKTVLGLTTLAHTDAFRQRTAAEPPRAQAEQQAYWASLCEAHLPVVNELIQRYRFVTYDYFAYEVSAWDVPVWYLTHAGCGYRTVLLRYKEWDQKPTIIEDGDADGDPPKIRPFQWTTASELNAVSSADATPGEFDLLERAVLDGARRLPRSCPPDGHGDRGGRRMGSAGRTPEEIPTRRGRRTSSA